MNINPAMIADDVADMYMIGKRSLGLGQNPNPNARNNQQNGQKQQANVVKQASPKTDAIKGIAGNFLNSQLVKAKNGLLSPTTGALTMGGLYSSMYGPEWAGGPTQEELDQGKRFNAKRAVKSVVTWNTLGRAISSVPNNTQKLLNSEGKRNIALNAAKVAPGVVGATAIGTNMLRGEEPDLENAKKRMGIASRVGMIGNIGSVGYDSMVNDVALAKAQHELAQEMANHMATQGGAQ